MSTMIALLMAGVLALLSASPAEAANSLPRELNFDVLLDDKPIGTHAFRISGDGDAHTVETRARFDVDILFVTVFSYRHVNTEIWRGGCVKRLDSETDSNGTPYRVELKRGDEGYRVTTLQDSADYAVDCLMTFAYWDRSFLRQPRLLNSQTGEVVDVQIQSLGNDRPEWLPVDTQLEGYRITAEPQKVDIRVYYDPRDDRWLGLESRLESGRLMRYVPAELKLRSAGTSALAAPGLEGST